MTPEEHNYLLNEISKTKRGRKMIKDSAKMMKKYPLPKIDNKDTMVGTRLPQGIPFRLNKK